MFKERYASRRRLVTVIVALLSLAWAATRFGFGYVHGDEGVALAGAWRVSAGQVPHHDFFEIIPPGSFLPTALAFRLMGVSFFAARLLVFAYAVALVVLCERLLASFCDDFLARVAVACALVPKGVYAWGLPSHHWVVDLAQLCALLCLSRGLRGQFPARWGAVAGAFSSYACFSLQDQGALFLVGLLIFVFPWVPDRDVRRHLALGWVAGGLAVAFGFAVYLLGEGSVAELIEQWIVHPAVRYRSIPHNQGWTLAALNVAWIGGATWRAGLRAAPFLTLGSTFFQLLGPAALLACPAVLWTAWRREWAAPAQVGLLGAGTLAFLGAAARRLTEVNLIWALPIPLVVLAWASARARSGADPRRRSIATLALGGLLLASIALAVGVLRRSLNQEIQVVQGRAGRLRVPASSQEAGIQPILDAIELHVAPGDPLFAYGYNPLIGFWTLRPNPTRYQFLAPGYHTAAQIEEALGDLCANPRAAVLQMAPYGPADDPWERFLREERRVAWSSEWGRLHVTKAPR